MKKQNLILWIAAFIITFLVGYLYSVTDEDYPVTGTIEVDSISVSYNFEKIFQNDHKFQILILTDDGNMTGNVFWRDINSKKWNLKSLISGQQSMKAEIGGLETNNKYEYYCVISYKGNNYQLPPEQHVKLRVTGSIPSTINLMNIFFLFGALLLSTRTGLEYFKEEDSIKKFSVLTVICFSFLFITTPLVRTYELGALNNSVPSISSLFTLPVSLMFAVWILSMVFSFYSTHYRKLIALATSVTLIIIYLSIR